MQCFFLDFSGCLTAAASTNLLANNLYKNRRRILVIIGERTVTTDFVTYFEGEKKDIFGSILLFI